MAKLTSVIKKMQEAGAQINQKNERTYVAEFQNTNVEFINDDGEVFNFYVISKTQKDDIVSDYFPGTFARNTKHAIALVQARA